MQINTIEKSEQKVNAVHITRSSRKPFAVALATFKELVGAPALQDIEEAVHNNKAEAVITAMEGKSHFMILGQLDMGAAVPSLKDQGVKAIQYLIGNPLYASKMIKHNIEVALYVPLRILIAENKEGTIFSYDLPSSLLGQWNESQINETAKQLDVLLEKLVESTLA